MAQKQPVSLSNYAEKSNSTKYNKPHCIIPIVDLKWVMQQVKTVQTLWDECWTTDPFGSRWVKLQSSLNEIAFRAARKILYAAGLFEFKRETCINDSRKTAGWLVINLHGARRIKDFWMKEEEELTISDEKISNNDVEASNNDVEASNNDVEASNNDEKISISDRKSEVIIAETLEKSSVSEPLSNSSVTLQEPLKEVPEEESTPAELVPRVRRRNTKTSERVARAMEHMFKLAQGYKPSLEDLIVHYFGRYKWKIDKKRLELLLELGKEFFIKLKTRFEYIWEAKGMSATYTFKEAIMSVSNNAQSIMKRIKIIEEGGNSMFDIEAYKRLST